MVEYQQLTDEKDLPFMQKIAPKYEASLTVLGRTGDEVVWGDGRKGPITLPDKVMVRVTSPRVNMGGFSEEWQALSVLASSNRVG